MDTTSFGGPGPEVSGAIVGIVLGSDSDRPVMEEAARTLAEYGIAYELVIASAHRSPDLLDRYAHSVEARGIRVLIAAAAGARPFAGGLARRPGLPAPGVPRAATWPGAPAARPCRVPNAAGAPVAT